MQSCAWFVGADVPDLPHSRRVRAGTLDAESACYHTPRVPAITRLECLLSHAWPDLPGRRRQPGIGVAGTSTRRVQATDKVAVKEPQARVRAGDAQAGAYEGDMADM